MSDDTRWTPFTRVIGEFFIEMGVQGGIEGKMFDMTPHAVQELVQHAGEHGHQ